MRIMCEDKNEDILSIHRRVVRVAAARQAVPPSLRTRIILSSRQLRLFRDIARHRDCGHRATVQRESPPMYQTEKSGGGREGCGVESGVVCGTIRVLIASSRAQPGLEELNGRASAVCFPEINSYRDSRDRRQQQQYVIHPLG